MCSTSSSNNDDGVGFGELSPTSLKKRHRIPKRGPGVAELEKILREQEKKSSVADRQDQRTSPSSHSRFVSSSSDVDRYLQQPHHQRYFSQPLVAFNNSNSISGDNNNYSNSNCANSLPRPSQVVPFPPVIWTSQNANIGAVEEGKSDGGILFGRVAPKQYFHSPTSVISPFPGSGSSVGLSHPIEPPSSQRPRHNYTSGQQDQKFVGIKRPLSMGQIPPLPPLKHRAPEKHNPNICKPMPRESDFNYFPSCNMEVHGVPEGSFIKIFSPNIRTASAPFQVFQPQFPKFDHNSPLQGNMKDLKQNSTGSDLNKPFYSFLPSNDPTGTKGASCGIEKVGEDGIDLNLKLSSN